MKKWIAGLLAVMMCATMCFAAVAEETEEAAEGSKFETMMDKKGELVSKIYIDCASIRGEMDEIITLQAAILTHITTGSTFRALRMSYYDEETKETIVGILDEEEIDEAISTLRYIQENMDKTEPYTEISYTASSNLVVGAYTGKVYVLVDRYAFIKFKSNKSVHFSLDSIDAIIGAMKMVQNYWKENP